VKQFHRIIERHPFWAFIAALQGPYILEWVAQFL
jgi:hypothetical protein